MPITIMATGVRRKEDTAPGTTTVIFDYKKMDTRVATLKVSLLSSSGSVLSYTTISVSTQAYGSTATYTVDLSNGLQVSNITALYVATDTIPAGFDANYTAPTGKIYLIGTNGDIYDTNGIYYGTAVIVPSGATISIAAPGDRDALVDIYEVDATALSPVSFTLKVEELDANGTTLYTSTATITDYPPLLVTSA